MFRFATSSVIALVGFLAAGCYCEISTTSLPEGTVGIPYDARLETNTSCRPGSWFITSGDLPPGISASDRGRLTGTPSVAGTFAFTASFLEGDGSSGAGSATLTVSLVILVREPVEESRLSAVRATG